MSATKDSIAAMKAGLPNGTFEDLAMELQVSTSVLARVISLPPRTLLRREQEGAFQADESGRHFCTLRLSERAAEVLGAGGTR